MMDISLYKSGYELWNAWSVWKNQTRARLDLTMSVCEIRYIKKGLDWNRFDFVRVSCRRTKNGSERIGCIQRLDWTHSDRTLISNNLKTGTTLYWPPGLISRRQDSWLFLPTRLCTFGSLAFSVSVPLHGLTFPFLSDRNPLWTPVQTKPHFFFQNDRSKHIKGSKERCLLVQNTTLEFSGWSTLLSHKKTLKQQLIQVKLFVRHTLCFSFICMSSSPISYSLLTST